MQNIDRTASEKFNISEYRCSRSCEKYYELLTAERYSVVRGNLCCDYNEEPTIISYRVGNTIFYIPKIPPKEVLDSGIFDRIIMELGLML